SIGLVTRGVRGSADAVAVGAGEMPFADGAAAGVWGRFFLNQLNMVASSASSSDGYTSICVRTQLGATPLGRLANSSRKSHGGKTTRARRRGHSPPPCRLG